MRVKTLRRKFGPLTKVNCTNPRAFCLKKRNMCHLVLITHKAPIAPFCACSISCRHKTARSLQAEFTRVFFSAACSVEFYLFLWVFLQRFVSIGASLWKRGLNLCADTGVVLSL